MSKTVKDEQLREEFNRWAKAGHGEEMESHHLPIVLPMLPLMKIGERDTVLDVGCGAGWLCRMLASQIPRGRVVGLDVSNEMIERARAASASFSNLTFFVGGVDRIPSADNSFSKVISVESAYYWPDPARGIQEIFRVLEPGGSAWILINYYRDNPHCHQWGAQYEIPSHLLWVDEWAEFYRHAGFTVIEHRRIPDESPTPEVYTGRWFRDAAQMRKFKQEGALLVWGSKPEQKGAERQLSMSTARTNDEDPPAESGLAQLALLERWNKQLRDHPLLVAAVLVLVTFAAYAPALANGFAFDDEQVIVQNPFVADPTWWRHIFSTPAWAFVGVKSWANYYRPFQIFCYWAVWRLAGPNPGAYHLLQLILYAASVWLLYRVALELIGEETAAFAGALLWALHPLHVEAVAWAAALPDVGVGFFVLLALLLFLRAERDRRTLETRHLVAAVAFGLGLFFKENALSLPPLLVAYWFFLGKPERWGRRLLRLLPYAAALGIYVAIRISVLGHFAAGAHILAVSRSVVGSALALLGAHLKLFVWPVALSPTRAFNWSAWLHSPWPWAALVLLAAAWALRRREPLFAFLVFTWLIALVPCLDVRQITTPFAADRYSFLPTIGLSLAVAWLIVVRLPKLRTRPLPIQASAAALAVVAVLWTVSTEAAIPHWRNSQALMQHGLEADSNAATPHIYRGIDLQYRIGDLKGAAREYRTAIQINESNRPLIVPVVCQADLGLGQIANLEGRPEQAMKYYGEVLRLCPDGHETFAVYDALGSMEFLKGDYSGAADYFRKAVRWGPVDVSGHYYLGTCEMKLGHPREAAEQFRIVRQIDPSLRPAYMAEAMALEAAGDAAAAARVRALTPQ